LAIKKEPLLSLDLRWEERRVVQGRWNLCKVACKLKKRGFYDKNRFYFLSNVNLDN
jgi:hypothetical protein